jgi:hypothetical protein
MKKRASPGSKPELMISCDFHPGKSSQIRDVLRFENGAFFAVLKVI